jgi:hypothetical protein
MSLEVAHKADLLKASPNVRFWADIVAVVEWLFGELPNSPVK